MSLRQRPECFTLDYSNPMVCGLVLAGFGNAPGSKIYYDSSSRKNSGTLGTGNPPTGWVWINELGRCGIKLTSTSHSVTLPNVPSLVFGVSDFSISIWCYLTGGNSYGAAIGCGNTGANEWMLRVNGFLWFYGDGGAISVNMAAPSWYTWHHVAVVRLGRNCSLYFNGDIVATDTSSSSDIASTQSVTIGKAGDRYIYGMLADPLIYKRALSLPEIQILADRSNPMLSGLIKPPKRKLYAVRSTTYSQRFFSLQTSIGAFALQT